MLEGHHTGWMFSKLLRFEVILTWRQKNVQLLCSVFSLDLIVSTLQTEASTSTQSTSGVIRSDPCVDVQSYWIMMIVRSSFSIFSAGWSFIHTNFNKCFFYIMFLTLVSFFLLIFIYTTKSTVVFHGLNVGPLYIIKRNLLQLSRTWFLFIFLYFNLI